MSRQIHHKDFFHEDIFHGNDPPNPGSFPGDMEEDLPFLPDSMKREREKGKSGRSTENSDISVPLFHVADDLPDNRETADPVSGRVSLESGFGEKTDLIETEREAEEDVFSERKYVVLVIYDIISNKQRVKMAKLLLGYGNRVQKSAFEARLNKKQYARLLRDIKHMLKEDDNVRIYKLHGYEEIQTFGDKKYDIIEDVIVI